MPEVFDINKSSERQAEKWFWAELNSVCLQCSCKCKQSAKVKLIQCVKFLKINNI
jgi:hypothetical protein